MWGGHHPASLRDSYTARRWIQRYGHIGQASQRQAVNALNLAGILDDGAQKWAQFQTPQVGRLPN
jgi:hypothetical protein